MPIAKIQLPDGRIARFEVAEGTTPEQVISFASQQDFAKQARGVSGKQLMAESGGRDFDKSGELLTSPKGAQGSRQVMPATSGDPGFGVRPADKAIMASGDKNAIAKELARVGDDYMDAMRKRYKGNEELALAAYNAGPGAVDRAGGKVPNIPETIAYVEKSLGKRPDVASVDYSGMPEIPASTTGNLLAGAVKGASNIGATVIAPYDIAKDAINGKGLSLESNRQRRADVTRGLQDIGADTDSGVYETGKLAAEVAGTSGVGGVLGKVAAKIPAIPQALVQSLNSGGMNVAGRTGFNALASRAVGGGITGGISAGMVEPDSAGFGAAIGAGFPVVAKGTAGLARMTGNALVGGGISQEVKALSDRARNLGIEIPADRIANSRPLNALASSLNYVPLSGRAGTESKMINQVKTAVSRTFGESTDNITQGLRAARQKLGGEFDRVLSSNTVMVDQQFLDDLARHADEASVALGKNELGIIEKQIDEIISKGSTGEIDGKAAYNIKRVLDRIGNRSGPEAVYALDLKRSLMEALNRSLPADDAAKFAATRQQYGNMLEVEKIAQNGADGDVSIARLANMRHINNPDLQEIADIAAQFVKGREGAHGAAQRVFLGGASLASPQTWPFLAAGVAAGRGTNMLLNSNAAKRAVTSGGLQASPALDNALTRLLPFAYQSGGLAPR